MSIQISTTVRQISATSSEASVRNHTCRVDRPESKGGSNQGPMGGELMLMGIGGCFMSNLLAGVASRNFAVNDLTVEVCATLETAPPRFSDIRLNVQTTCFDRSQLHELIAEAEANCIAINTAKGVAAVSVELS